MSLYIGEIVGDAEEKGFYNCQNQKDKTLLHTFDQWVLECGGTILSCKNCGKIFELD